AFPPRRSSDLARGLSVQVRAAAGAIMQFRVWAPRAESLSVRVIGGPTVQMERSDDGYFTARAEVGPGARYFFRFPDGRERPDPRSLFQPEGVHGPSEIV